jgi:OST3 / OST6 family, transporter family
VTPWIFRGLVSLLKPLPNGSPKELTFQYANQILLFKNLLNVIMLF